MDRERRRTPRVALAAEIRIRAAGTGGRGIACRVHDGGAHGFGGQPAEPLGADWQRIEILKRSGEAHARPLEARVVHAGTDAQGALRVGCSFD